MTHKCIGSNVKQLNLSLACYAPPGLVPSETLFNLEGDIRNDRLFFDRIEMLKKNLVL